MSRKLRYSPQQKQESVSRKQFEAFLAAHEFVTGDISPDLGEDFLVRIYEKGVSTGLSFYVQLKSIDSIEKHILQSGNISYPFEVKDLEHLAAQVVTVLLVVWDVKQNQGWWIWINDAIKFLQKNNPGWEQNETANIHLPSTNQLNEDRLREIRNRLADLYYPIVSKDKELTINAKFTFPQTSEGKIKFEELKRHFAVGDELELDGKYIEAFDFPDWWKRLYGEFDLSAMHLKLMSNSSQAPRPTQFTFVSETDNETIPYVELWAVKQGEEEITLTNDQQRIPVKFCISINKVSQRHQIKIHANLSNLDGIEVLNVLRMQKILFDGGSIQLTFLDTGEVMTVPVPSRSFPAPEQSVIDFVEKICIIQKAVGTRIKFPEDGSFAKEDIQAVDELISVVEKGSYKQSGMVFTVELRKHGIAKLIEGITDGSPIFFQITTGESYVELLSQKIELGPMLQKIRGYWRMPLEEVHAWFENAKDEDFLVVRLVDVELYEEFDKWINR
jgi:hypothetical protein